MVRYQSFTASVVIFLVLVVARQVAGDAVGLPSVLSRAGYVPFFSHGGCSFPSTEPCRHLSLHFPALPSRPGYRVVLGLRSWLQYDHGGYGYYTRITLNDIMLGERMRGNQRRLLVPSAIPSEECAQQPFWQTGQWLTFFRSEAQRAREGTSSILLLDISDWVHQELLIAPDNHMQILSTWPKEGLLGDLQNVVIRFDGVFVGYLPESSVRLMRQEE